MWIDPNIGSKVLAPYTRVVASKFYLEPEQFPPQLKKYCDLMKNYTELDKKYPVLNQILLPLSAWLLHGSMKTLDTNEIRDFFNPLETGYGDCKQAAILIGNLLEKCSDLDYYYLIWMKKIPFPDHIAVVFYIPKEHPDQSISGYYAVEPFGELEFPYIHVVKGIVLGFDQYRAYIEEAGEGMMK